MCIRDSYTDNGYNNKTSLWSDQWAADQGPAGKVFGFFYSCLLYTSRCV